MTTNNEKDALASATMAAEADRDGSGSRREETDGKMLGMVGTDALKWAKELNRTANRLGLNQMNEDLLMGWFANAIEAGRMAAEGSMDRSCPIEHKEALDASALEAASLKTELASITSMWESQQEVLNDYQETEKENESLRAENEKLRKASLDIIYLYDEDEECTLEGFYIDAIERIKKALK